MPIDEIQAELMRTSRWEGEIEKTKVDGTRVVVASRWSLRRNEQRSPIAILETNNDVTQRKRAEEEVRKLKEAQIAERNRAEEALHRAQAELAHVTRVTTVGEMTAAIAHEVNQPRAAVVTNAGACLRWISGPSPDLEEARQALGRIVRDGNRAGEVIARIRALVKKSPPQQDRLDINQTIQEIILLTDAEVRRNRIWLQTQLSRHLPPILGDRIQLQQVILNLI